MLDKIGKIGVEKERRRREKKNSCRFETRVHVQGHRLDPGNLGSLSNGKRKGRINGAKTKGDEKDVDVEDEGRRDGRAGN